MPSKIFEYAYLGLPMVYFGGGEGESVVRENNLGWVVEVGDYSLLNKTIDTIEKKIITNGFKKQIQQKAKEGFSFDNQLSDLITKI